MPVAIKSTRKGSSGFSRCSCNLCGDIQSQLDRLSPKPTVDIACNTVTEYFPALFRLNGIDIPVLFDMIGDIVLESIAHRHRHIFIRHRETVLIVYGSNRSSIVFH